MAIYDDFKIGKPLGYRCVNLHPDQMADEDSYWGLQTVAETFEANKLPGLSWRYLRDCKVQYNKIIKDIPIIHVIDMMMLMAQPEWTKYTEVNEDREFSRISGDFYMQLFFHESIWITYKFFEKESNYEIKSPDEGVKQMIRILKRINSFDLWVKLTDTIYDEDIEFMHLKTGLILKIPNYWEKMAHCQWSARKLNNFRNWFTYAITYTMETMKMERLGNLVGKKVMIAGAEESTSEIDKIAGALDGVNSHLYIPLTNGITIRAVEYSTGDELHAYTLATFSRLDRWAYELGRVANMNPKGERVTTGENYKDIYAHACRLKETLEQLIEFANQAKELWGIELDFAVSGIPEKEAIYTIGHLAQNPNMEKEFFGQIEGTMNRTPKGEKTPYGQRPTPGKKGFKNIGKMKLRQ